MAMLSWTLFVETIFLAEIDAGLVDTVSVENKRNFEEKKKHPGETSFPR